MATSIPRLGNDKQVCCEGLGIWGGISMARDVDGQTCLIVPMGGPPAADGPKFSITNGPTPHGSLMALRVAADPKGTPELQPAWISGDFDMPDPAVITNGVVFAVSTGSNEVQRGGEATRVKSNHPAVLKALDLATGKELFNSGNTIESWTHFSGLAVSEGQVFAVDHDSNVYAFGLPVGVK